MPHQRTKTLSEYLFVRRFAHVAAAEQLLRRGFDLVLVGQRAHPELRRVRVTDPRGPSFHVPRGIFLCVFLTFFFLNFG